MNSTLLCLSFKWLPPPHQSWLGAGVSLGLWKLSSKSGSRFSPLLNKLPQLRPKQTGGMLHQSSIEEAGTWGCQRLSSLQNPPVLFEILLWGPRRQSEAYNRKCHGPEKAALWWNRWSSKGMSPVHAFNSVWLRFQTESGSAADGATAWWKLQSPIIFPLLLLRLCSLTGHFHFSEETRAAESMARLAAGEGWEKTQSFCLNWMPSQWGVGPRFSNSFIQFHFYSKPSAWSPNPL